MKNKKTKIAFVAYFQGDDDIADDNLNDSDSWQTTDSEFDDDIDDDDDDIDDDDDDGSYEESNDD